MDAKKQKESKLRDVDCNVGSNGQLWAELESTWLKSDRNGHYGHTEYVNLLKPKKHKTICSCVRVCVCALAYRVNCRYLPENTPVKCRYHVNCRHRQL